MHAPTHRLIFKKLAVALIAAIPFSASAIEIDAPSVGLADVPMEYAVDGAVPGAEVTLSVDGNTWTAVADDAGRAEFETFEIESAGKTQLQAASGDETATLELRVVPGWVSILPALIAIVVALTLRNVIPALLLGLWLGAMALQSFTLKGAGQAMLDTFQVYVRGALADSDRASIVLFSMMIGGMVGIITRNGGMASIVLSLVSRAKTAVAGQVAVWLMGLMIFFDDYSNTLVVGNTARSLTDKLNISREKLAYIVDSTAAPVACIALITTWIGYQIGLIAQTLGTIPELSDMQAYTVFLESIPYSFYPILAIIFVFLISSTGLDFGPMYKAEVRARGGAVKPKSGEDLPALEGDELNAKENIPLRAFNGFVPILALIAALGVSLVMLGEGSTMREIIGTTDPYRAMMYSSFVGVLVAATMTIGQGILTVHETVDAWFGGVRAMLFGMVILVLAWSLSDVTAALNTASFLVTVLADAVPAPLIPAIIFVLAAITAFTTGTSWGTMAILMPLILPLAWAVMSMSGMDSPSDMHIIYSSVACVLCGAVWGDHCSPISDTTVLSSVASGCNHVEHVRTQLPYAMTVGGVGLFFGTIPGGYGFPAWLSILIGIGVLVGVLKFFGKNSEAADVGG